LADKCQRGGETVVRADGSVEIPLTQGLVSVVDSGSYPLVRDHLWLARFNPCTSSFYSLRFSGRPERKCIMMHSVVVGEQFGRVIDHVNHDTLDNRIRNLRIASHQQNSGNMRPRSGCSSRFKGVAQRENGRWRAYVNAGGMRRNIGTFDSEIDAAMAYDDAARDVFGEFAFTNADAGLL